MKLFKIVIVVWVLGLTGSSGLLAAQDPGAGQVQLPLDAYARLEASAASRTPAGYSIGGARATVRVEGTDQRATGTVEVRFTIDVRADPWVLVPVLQPGCAVESAAVAGKPVQLVATADGPAWSAPGSGAFEMSVIYRVEATRSAAGFNLSVPLPRAPSVQIVATLPIADLDVAVIPSSGVTTASKADTTEVTASVPSSSGVQISWRLPSGQRYSVSRAGYRGTLAQDAVVWSVELGIELFGDRAVLVPLFPRSVVLTGLAVDGGSSPIVVAGDRLATLVRGAGAHKIVAGFETRVLRDDGPPRVDFETAQVPVSRFELTLPGSKTLTVAPTAHVTSRSSGGSTVATVYVPMTDRVSLAWSEAVPGEATEVRAGATIYHVVHLEEAVLHVRAMVDYEVARGETSVIELGVPANVQIDRVGEGSDVVADWRVGPPLESGERIVSVFLDRPLRGRLLFEVLYDRPLAGATGATSTTVPLLQAIGAQRPRGMIALLASADVTLNPTDTGGAAKIGENQLPEFVRQSVSLTVAHTFKYADARPALVVEAAAPVREQPRFDAQVDALASLGDVTLTVASSVEIRVKSGRVRELHLLVPQAVNVLDLSAPSLRTYTVAAAGGATQVDLEFTQEMEGAFRVELTYEKIQDGTGARVPVPTPSVAGAEVEQGRIAVEALTALEVRPASAEHLSPLEINELPRQLLLRTTNPILLAYKYVQATPPHDLTLDVAHHRILEVQEASIDRADYRTLFTSDGLAVTSARFIVRNGRKQFLRIELPKASEVWSLLVDGKPEKPALADADSQSVLIKIINSAEGFPVELVYASSTPPVGRRGEVRGSLPRPDVLVAQSRWEVLLPDEMRYDAPSTNMKRVDPDPAGFASASATSPSMRVTVPATGQRFAFEKLYANQSDQQAWFSVSYRKP